MKTYTEAEVIKLIHQTYNLMTKDENDPDFCPDEFDEGWSMACHGFYLTLKDKLKETK